MADDLDSFLKWCRDRGHYMVKPLAENFRNYEKERKEAEVDAMNERVKSDE
jgi:hypothetical protein